MHLLYDMYICILCDVCMHLLYYMYICILCDVCMNINTLLPAHNAHKQTLASTNLCIFTRLSLSPVTSLLMLTAQLGEEEAH